jgi:hypothetical protein
MMIEHYVIDRTKGLIYFRDSVTGKLITTYKLKVGPTEYRGERSDNGRNNMGASSYTYDSISISRENGTITTSTLTTTDWKHRSPTTDEMVWVGRCEKRGINQREALKF